jgi:hypothetical protein
MKFLSRLNDLLLYDGLLIVTTENIANPFGGRIQQYLDFTHEYNFTDRSLEYLLRSSGFEDVNICEPDLRRPKSLKGKLKVFIQNLFYWTYKKIIETERYGLINPKFYGKSLIGFASRKTYESKT